MLPLAIHGGTCPLRPHSMNYCLTLISWHTVTVGVTKRSLKKHVQIYLMNF
jgi:hypothetical protein